MNVKPNTPAQLISFVLDNSASLSREKLAALMGSFRRLAEEKLEEQNVFFELLCYDTFTPAVVKSFDDAEIAPVFAGRMPLLSRTVECALQRLLDQSAKLREASISARRPWLVVLCDGFTFDKTDALAARLCDLEKEGTVLYLPFLLRETPLCERLEALNRAKRMIGITEGGIDALFDFLHALLQRIAESAPDEGVRLGRSDFEGWAVL